MDIQDEYLETLATWAELESKRLWVIRIENRRQRELSSEVSAQCARSHRGREVFLRARCAYPPCTLGQDLVFNTRELFGWRIFAGDRLRREGWGVVEGELFCKYHSGNTWETWCTAKGTTIAENFKELLHQALLWKNTNDPVHGTNVIAIAKEILRKSKRNPAT